MQTAMLNKCFKPLLQELDRREPMLRHTYSFEVKEEIAKDRTTLIMRHRDSEPTTVPKKGIAEIFKSQPRINMK